jgi:dolichyl-phosphate-mannose--protein O-mannosyl transferase
VRHLEINSKSLTTYLLAGIIGFYLVACGVRLGFPGKQYYDEVYFAKTAQEIILGQRTFTETTHPPLGKLYIAASLWLLGDESWVWRLPSLVCGTLLLIVLFSLTQQLTRNPRLALLVTFLMAIDGIHITQSRIAMVNAPMLLWMFLALLALLPYLTGRVVSRSRSFLAAGIFLGAAISVRWAGFYVYPLILLCLAFRFWREKEQLSFVSDLLVYLFLVPILLYFATHTIIPMVQGYPWKNIWTIQQHMYRYHVDLRATHGYSSAWWSWPLIIRPIWYFFERKNELVYGILCIGNPAVYWVGPFAIGYVLFKWMEERKFLYGFILAGFFSQWLPWILPKRVEFFHYFYSAVPFVFMAVALLLQRFWQIPKVGKWIVAGYLLIVTGLFIYWYPLYTGLPISEASYRNHLWFKAWI